MTNKPFIDHAGVERRIKQAHAERARFMSTFLRKNTKPLVWTVATLGALYLAVVSMHVHTIAPLG